jgi:hypothetical protein
MIKYIKATNSNTFFKFDTEACTIIDLSNVNYKSAKELEVAYLDNYYIKGACVFAKKSILTYLGTDYEIDDDEIVFFVPSFKEKLLKETFVIERVKNKELHDKLLQYKIDELNYYYRNDNEYDDGNDEQQSPCCNTLQS